MLGESILTHQISHILLFLSPWESVAFWKTQHCLSHWHSFSVLRSVHDLHQKLLMDGIAWSVFGFQRKGPRWDYDILLLTCKRVSSFFSAVNKGPPVYFSDEQCTPGLFPSCTDLIILYHVLPAERGVTWREYWWHPCRYVIPQGY